MNGANHTMSEMPKCPWCGHPRHVRPLGCHAFYCGGCKREFEDVDDGEVGYGMPEKFAMRKERHEQRKEGRR